MKHGKVEDVEILEANDEQIGCVRMVVSRQDSQKAHCHLLTATEARQLGSMLTAQAARLENRTQGNPARRPGNAKVRSERFRQAHQDLQKKLKAEAAKAAGEDNTGEYHFGSASKPDSKQEAKMRHGRVMYCEVPANERPGGLVQMKFVESVAFQCYGMTVAEARTVAGMLIYQAEILERRLQEDLAIEKEVEGKQEAHLSEDVIGAATRLVEKVREGFLSGNEEHDKLNAAYSAGKYRVDDNLYSSMPDAPSRILRGYEPPLVVSSEGKIEPLPDAVTFEERILAAKAKPLSDLLGQPATEEEGWRRLKALEERVQNLELNSLKPPEKERAGHDFLWAYKRLQEGFSVRRSGWGECPGITPSVLDGKSAISVLVDHLEATDWELA